MNNEWLSYAEKALFGTSVLWMCYGTSLDVCLISCVCVCMHTCTCVHLCMTVCVCVCVSVRRCWYAWNSPVDRVLAYSPTHLGGEDLQFRSCCVNTHSLLFSSSIPKVLPGGFPCMKHSGVIPFPYMEFHVYSLYLCQLLLCIEVVELLLIQHAY